MKLSLAVAIQLLAEVIADMPTLWYHDLLGVVNMNSARGYQEGNGWRWQRKCSIRVIGVILTLIRLLKSNN